MEPIDRRVLIEELRAAGYRFKQRTKRAEIYKRSNPISYVPVPTAKLLAPEAVGSIRRQMGHGMTRQ